jgi:hypothetical protein
VTPPRKPDDRYVDKEAELAAREAAGIGGRAGDEDLDPAERPLRESGEGESEGFEDTEAELIENASHGNGVGEPEADRFTPERESDRSTAEYGKPDEEEELEK